MRQSERHFLTRVGKQIELVSGKGHEETSFFIPAFELGLPVYDVEEVRDGILDTLRGQGYAVEAQGSSALHIDWSRARITHLSAPSRVII